MVSNIEDRQKEAAMFNADEEGYIHLELKDHHLETVANVRPDIAAIMFGGMLRSIADDVAKMMGIDVLEVQKDLVELFAKAFEIAPEYLSKVDYN